MGQRHAWQTCVRQILDGVWLRARKEMRWAVCRHLSTIGLRDLSGPAYLPARPRRHRATGRLGRDHDRAFTDARLAEIRRLLDDDKLRGRGVLAERVSTVTAYRQWSAGYDAEAAGGLFAMDEPVVASYLDGRKPGVALDAACGTGRFAEFLATRGHRVIGVDSSPDMLAHARRRVPDGEFHVGELAPSATTGS
jgi:Methyltransferase domain